jgi:hypothetical protein
MPNAMLILEKRTHDEEGGGLGKEGRGVSLFVVGHLNHQAAIKRILEVLGEHEGNEVP